MMLHTSSDRYIRIRDPTALVTRQKVVDVDNKIENSLIRPLTPGLLAITLSL